MDVALSRPRRVRISLGPTLATTEELPRSTAGFVALGGRSLALGMVFGATLSAPWAEAPGVMLLLLVSAVAWALPALGAETAVRARYDWGPRPRSSVDRAAPS